MTIDTDAIEEVFDTIYNEDGMILKPAESLDIAKCQRDLHDIGGPALPPEYIELLKMSNGLSWEGIEMFGTFQVVEKESGYILNDLVTVNDDFIRSKKINDTLILGRQDEDLFVYNQSKKCYQIIDCLMLLEIETFSSFDDFFAEIFYSAFGDDENEEELDPENISMEDDDEEDEA